MTTAVLLLASALLVRLWQRRGVSLSELAHRIGPLMLLWLWVVPYLPWLPDSVPLLLVFGGRMRWVVAGVAAFGIFARFVTVPRRGLRSFAVPRTLVFLVSFVVYVALGFQFARDVGFVGDEPALSRHHAEPHRRPRSRHRKRSRQRDYRAYFPGELRPDFLQRGLRGEIYSIHAPGLPALLVPAFAVGGALGTVVFIALLSALAAVAVFDAATLLTTPGVAAIVWVVTCFSLPFVPHAWLVYPEAPGALITAWATVWLLRPPASIGRTFVHGLVFAALRGSTRSSRCCSPCSCSLRRSDCGRGSGTSPRWSFRSRSPDSPGTDSARCTVFMIPKRRTAVTRGCSSSRKTSTQRNARLAVRPEVRSVRVRPLYILVPPVRG